MVGIGFLFINDFDTQLRWHVFCLCLFLSSKVECFSRGLECAKLQHLAIGKEVQTCLDMSHVINAGPCLYAVIQDVSLKRKNMSVKLNLNLSRVFFFFVDLGVIQLSWIWIYPGFFFFFFVDLGVIQGTPDAKFYGHPHSLLIFGQFLLKAHISRARGRGLKARELPLIISAPSFNKASHCLLLGLPPLALDSPKK